ncbi:UNVERIFIED_CONTAM: F-box/LRR-repeat protein 18 [Gekko kuhli]
MDMLKHCKCLRDLRLEQPYFNANAQFFQALSHCSSLQRLCIISRRGTLQPDAVVAFMTACLEVVMLHMFTGESLTVCKNLQQSLIWSPSKDQAPNRARPSTANSVLGLAFAIEAPGLFGISGKDGNRQGKYFYCLCVAKRASDTIRLNPFGSFVIISAAFL